MKNKENTTIKELIDIINAAVKPIEGRKMRAKDFHSFISRAIDMLIQPFDMIYGTWKIHDINRDQYRADGLFKMEHERIDDKRAQGFWKTEQIWFEPYFNVSPDITIADYLKRLKYEDLLEDRKYADACIQKLKGDLARAEGDFQAIELKIKSLKAELKIV